jgi:two-component system, chemotaxis family, protein-glutamate methylesterase/glutaminase
MNIVVIGASAGGVEALSSLMSAMPGSLDAAILIVVHFPEHSKSVLPTILARKTSLRVSHAADGDPIEPSRVYVAPPGCHLIVTDGSVTLSEGPRENTNRPAIDPLFRSAARTYGRNVIGVLLSGLLDDGTVGMAAIRRHGGVTIAQDPDDALFGDMPRSAINNVGVDHVLPLSQIPAAIVSWSRRPDPPSPEPAPAIDPVEMNMEQLSELEHKNGKPSEYTCPECAGTLYEVTEDGMPHFRCRVGHAYSFETLESEQSLRVEAAMWCALRSMEENIGLKERLMNRARSSGLEAVAMSFEKQVKDQSQHAETLRSFIESGRS